MVGLLYALPGTQLAQRLLAEGRLETDARAPGEDDADQCSSGLNFAPLRPRRDVLRDYRAVIDSIYAPAAFFGRARRAGRELDCSAHHVAPSLRNVARDLHGFARMAWRMGVRDSRVRGEWWLTLAHCLFHNPRALKIVLSFGALYLHLGGYSRQLVERLDRQIGLCEPGSATAGRAGVAPHAQL
jgi:hypothetical protein